MGKWLDTESNTVVDSQPEEGRQLVAEGSTATAAEQSRVDALTSAGTGGSGGSVEVHGAPADGDAPLWNEDTQQWEPGASGTSSAVTERAEYRALEQAMPLSNGQFAWTQVPGDAEHTALLDLTDPANPTIITAGVYAFTVYARPNATSPGKFASLQLSLDDTGFGWLTGDTAPLDVRGYVNTAMTVWLPAGAVVTTYFFQDDVADAEFIALMAVQRIS